MAQHPFTHLQALYSTASASPKASVRHPAPVIVGADTMPAPVARYLGLDTEPGELFVVAQSGVHAGRWFEAGEVLVCSGDAGTGDVLVLVARGFGRPRLGTAVGARLMGDAGEPCHPDRWRSAGRVLARVHAGGNEWVAAVVESARCAGSGGVPSRGAAAGGRGGRTPAAILGAGTASGALRGAGVGGPHGTMGRESPPARDQLPLFSVTAAGVRRAA